MQTTSLQSATLQPWFTVPDGEAAVIFYKAAFNAVETYRLPDAHAGVVVQLEINNAPFWVSDGDAQAPLGGNSLRLILISDEPEAVFTKALRAGATEIFPVGEAHGWRLGRLVDPFGLHWEIGHQISS